MNARWHRQRDLSLVFLFAAVLACSGRQPTPVEITLNEEICSHCRMAISQREFAGEVVTTTGAVFFADDIGCLVRLVASSKPPPEAGVFVVDHANGEWLDARMAHYLSTTRLPTPMGSGLAAFATEDEARAAADRLEGRVLQWNQLLEEALLDKPL